MRLRLYRRVTTEVAKEENPGREWSGRGKKDLYVVNIDTTLRHLLPFMAQL